MLETLFAREIPELGVSAEDAKKFKQDPRLVVNTDPVAVKCNLKMAETQFYHQSLKKVPQKEEGASRQGGSLTQRVKSYPTVTLSGETAKTIHMVPLKPGQLPTVRPEAGYGIMKIVLDGLFTSASAGAPDEAWLFDPKEISSGALFREHRTKVSDPFIDAQRMVVDPEWDPSMPVPVHLRAVRLQDGEMAGLVAVVGWAGGWGAGGRITVHQS